MEKRLIKGFLFFAALSSLLMSGCVSSRDRFGGEKPVIVIAAFGSSYPTGQGNLEDFDKAVRAAFPDNEVTWGFTASFIVKKLRKNGVETLFESRVPVRTIEETIAGLREEGKTNLVVVNFMLMVGAEYRQVLEVPTPGMNVKYIHPLLYYPDNIGNVVTALEGEFGSDGAATVVCAHGNEDHPQYNAELVEIDGILRSEYENTYLALMEGEPSFGPVKEEIIASGADRVKFVSFMLTYGDHMSNDVMGDGEDSFKTRLGLPAEVSDGLASVAAVQQLFIGRIRSVLGQF